jgi:hypothetical protein
MTLKQGGRKMKYIIGLLFVISINFPAFSIDYSEDQINLIIEAGLDPDTLERYDSEKWNISQFDFQKRRAFNSMGIYDIDSYFLNELLKDIEETVKVLIAASDWLGVDADDAVGLMEDKKLLLHVKTCIDRGLNNLWAEINEICQRSNRLQGFNLTNLMLSILVEDNPAVDFNLRLSTTISQFRPGLFLLPLSVSNDNFDYSDYKNSTELAVRHWLDCLRQMPSFDRALYIYRFGDLIFRPNDDIMDEWVDNVHNRFDYLESCNYKNSIN